MSGRWILFLLALTVGLPRQALAQSSDDLHSNVLKRETMEIIWDELINRGVRVAFLAVPHDPANGITLADRTEQIEKIPESDRTYREKMLLRVASEGHIPSTAIASFGDDNLSITLPDKVAEPAIARATLQKVAALDLRYELVWFADFPVLCPRSGELRDVRVDLTLKNVPAFQAVGLLSKELLRHNVGFSFAHIGPGNPEDDYGHNIINLDLVHVPLMDALTQLCNALGPGYTWEILGTKGSNWNCGICNVARR